MAGFTSFTNILPDPNNAIGNAGQASVSGRTGAGFASVSLLSEQPTIKDFTNSGRILGRAIAAHKWKIKINYNPMTREAFEPIYTFLLQRRGPINPFYVSLPQHSAPKNAAFATFAASNNLQAISDVTAGATSALLGFSGSYTIAVNGTPLPGDMFTIDGSNSNHKKAYMVTRVETPEDGNYLEGSQPGTNQVRVHFTPGLSKEIGADDAFVFNNPLIKVIMTGDVQEYSLNTQNLYSFSLNLEEVQ